MKMNAHGMLNPSFRFLFGLFIIAFLATLASDVSAVETGTEWSKSYVHQSYSETFNAKSGAVEDGYEGEFQAGIHALVQAQSREVGIGNEYGSVSTKVDAQVEALLGATGKIGAHITDTGITIGAEVVAGAFVRGEVGLTMTARVFGTETNVRVYAEGYAGAMAKGKASVTIGFDGNIEFNVGAGVAVGVGVGAGVQFDMDASQLIAQLGLSDMVDLINWLDEFSEDPWERMKGLGIEVAKELGREALNRVGDVVATLDNSIARFMWGSAYEYAHAEFERWAGPASYSDQDGYQTPELSKTAEVEYYPYRPPSVCAPPAYTSGQAGTPASYSAEAYHWPAPYQWPAPLKW